MEVGPQRRLVDVRFVMKRCGVGKTKAREIMRMVGEIRLGKGKRSSVRVDEGDLEAWIEAQKQDERENGRWQKSTNVPGRPTTTPTSSTPTETGSANQRVAEIRAQLLE